MFKKGDLVIITKDTIHPSLVGKVVTYIEYTHSKSNCYPHKVEWEYSWTWVEDVAPLTDLMKELF